MLGQLLSLLDEDNVVEETMFERRLSAYEMSLGTGIAEAIVTRMVLRLP
jgi:hypothetical protein